MPVRIIVIGDTHISDFNELPPEMLKAILNADMVLHVGDYTSKSILDGLIKLKGSQFVGVYGNADPLSIRNQVFEKEIIEVNGKKIGITHPAVGGTYENTKKKVLRIFKDDNVDAIIYGHTHDPGIEKFNGIMLVNPGKGYSEKEYFGAPTSYAILTVDDKIHAEIINIE
ncbi:MAG: YfcE family phosphodiesterase [Promethearchaeota archaeon]